MPGELTSALEALEAGLAAACPGRYVSRSFKPLPLRTEEELTAGVFSVISRGASRFANYRGREGDLGTLRVVIVGQVKVAEDADQKAIEDAEFAMIEQVTAFVQAPLLSPLRQCLPVEYSQSAQLEHPYGWVAIECEVMT